MPTDPTAPSVPLMSWILDSLARSAEAWTPEQSAFLESLLARPDGARVLASLVATTLRLRGTGLRPDQMGQVGALLPVIEAFWDAPSERTYRELRIARW